MADRVHGHAWSGWSSWAYAGGNTDERSRRCLDTGQCGYSETQTRRHQHTQPYTQVINEVTVRRCGSCDATL